MGGMLRQSFLCAPIWDPHVLWCSISSKHNWRVRSLRSFLCTYVCLNMSINRPCYFISSIAEWGNRHLTAWVKIWSRVLSEPATMRTLDVSPSCCQINLQQRVRTQNSFCTVVPDFNYCVRPLWKEKMYRHPHPWRYTVWSHLPPLLYSNSRPRRGSRYCTSTSFVKRFMGGEIGEPWVSHRSEHMTQKHLVWLQYELLNRESTFPAWFSSSIPFLNLVQKALNRVELTLNTPHGHD